MSPRSPRSLDSRFLRRLATGARAAALLACALPLATGCRSAKPLQVVGEDPAPAAAPAAGAAETPKGGVLAVVPEGTDPERIRQIAEAKLAEGVDEFERTQKDVGLDAVMEGKNLRVKVANRMSKPLVVGSKNLAVLPPGARAPIPFPDRLVSFPAQTLQPGEEKVGILPGQAVAGRTRGARILFSHPECRPAMAPLRDGSN